jgi:hypothetical protein
MEKRVYEYESREKGKVQQVIDTEPYADRSFAKQGYKVKEGKNVGGEEGKYYLYIQAEPDFFGWAEEKFKAAELETFKRVPTELEGMVVQKIEDEDSAAEAGFGAIFG